MLEGQRTQAGAKFFQLVFQILADEEVGIGKTSAQDVFIALPDEVEVLGVTIPDDDEVGQEGAVVSRVCLRREARSGK